MAGVVKLWRFPDGFFEPQMWGYFSQFGRVQKLKLIRSKKTGRSKRLAYIQFEHSGVAKIVAETMNNYLMFECLMKCEYIPEEEIPAQIFKNWKKIAVPGLRLRKHMKLVNSFKDDAHIIQSRRRLFIKLVKRNVDCAKLGINYQFKIPPVPGLPYLSTDFKPKIKKEEKTDPADNETTLNRSELEKSPYSVVIDSSDDEIEFKTPPMSIKKRRLDKSKNEEKSKRKIDVKPELLSSSSEEGENEKIEKRAAKKKNIRARDGSVGNVKNKLKKTKRYFTSN